MMREGRRDWWWHFKGAVSGNREGTEQVSHQRGRRSPVSSANGGTDRKIYSEDQAQVTVGKLAPQVRVGTPGKLIGCRLPFLQ